MTLSAEARYYIGKRETLSVSETDIVDEAFRTLYRECRYLGIPAATDDRAAELEAAMIKFILDSRGG
jgi:hypothetical protein